MLPDPAGGNRRQIALTDAGQALVEHAGTDLIRRLTELVESCGVPFDRELAQTRWLNAALEAPGRDTHHHQSEEYIMIATPTTATAPTVRTVRSADGTPISYHRTGTGPSILVIPDALNDAGDYTALSTALSAHFTVHTIQRRARTGSGPQGPNYSIATECADLAAVRAAVALHRPRRERRHSRRGRTARR